MTTYTVQAGDTISKIALNVLGNMSVWPKLAAVNNIAAPYRIYPGQVLQLPGTALLPVPAGASMPVPSTGSGGGIMQWIMANKLLIGGGIALLAITMLAMSHQKKRTGKKRRVRAG